MASRNRNSDRTKKIVLGGLRFVFGLLVNLIIVIVLIEGFTISFRFGYNVFVDTPRNLADDSKVVVTIQSDSSSMEVVDLIYDSGVIADKYVFMTRTYVEGYYKKIQPATYELSPSMTNQEILKRITGQITE